MQELRAYRFSSFAHLWEKRKRSPSLDFEACLDSAGGLKDTPSGRRKYQEYLQWLAEDEPGQKEMHFEKMSTGWAMGTKDFRKALLREEKALKACMAMGVEEARGMRDAAWSLRLDACLKVLGKGKSEIKADLKSAEWKVAIAAYMKTKKLCRNGWLAERLQMGSESSVARYVSEFLRGKRALAQPFFDRLVTRVLD